MYKILAVTLFVSCFEINKQRELSCKQNILLVFAHDL